MAVPLARLRPLLWDGRAVVLFSLVVAGCIRLPTLFQPLLEAHPFRQTQTAYTAVLYHRNGIDLLHTPLPVVGPPWEVPFEFPLFQAGGAVLMNLGLAMEPALRGLSLACFLASAAVLWQLIARERGPLSAGAGALFFLFSPFSLLWSRASMTEYLATFLGISFAALALSWGQSGHRQRLAGAIAVGTLAMLVKITTGFIWIAPALLLVRGRIRDRLPLVAIPLLAGLGWTAWADAIKAGGLITRHLTSSALSEWNLGTVAQRIDPATWRAFDRWSMPLGVAGLPAILLVRPRRERPGLLAWFGLIVIGGPLLFTNLYAVHAYYWVAISPAIAGILGIGFTAALERLPHRWVVAVATVAIALALAVRTYVGSAASWSVIYEGVSDPENVLPIASQIREATTKDDLIFIVGRDWTPAIFLYADRRGVMLPFFMSAATLDLTGYVKFQCPGWSGRGRCVPIK